MVRNKYVNASLSQDEAKAIYESAALTMCATLSAKVSELADEANVENIAAAFTSGVKTVYGLKNEPLALYINIYAAMREFTPEEQSQCEQYNRSTDSAQVLKVLVADTKAVLMIAAESGLTEMFISKDCNRNFCDDICLVGMNKPCGKILVNLTLVPADRRPCVVEREMLCAHKVDIPNFFKNIITTKVPGFIKLGEAEKII